MARGAAVLAGAGLWILAVLCARLYLQFGAVVLWLATPIVAVALLAALGPLRAAAGVALFLGLSFLFRFVFSGPATLLATLLAALAGVAVAIGVKVTLALRKSGRTGRSGADRP